MHDLNGTNATPCTLCTCVHGVNFDACTMGCVNTGVNALNTDGPRTYASAVTTTSPKLHIAGKKGKKRREISAGETDDLRAVEGPASLKKGKAPSPCTGPDVAIGDPDAHDGYYSLLERN